jgi:peptide/nickel transport system substrate-binding protein
VKQDLEAIGVTAEIEIVDLAQFVGSRIPNEQYQLAVTVQTSFLEPDEWLRGQHHSQSARNWFGIADPELDAMLEHQLTVLDREERVEEIHEIQRYIVENVANPAPLWTYLSLIMVSERVQNWYPQNGGARYEMRHIWLDQD